MDNNESTSSGLRIFLTVLWCVSVIVAGYIGYAYGKGQSNAEKKVLTANTNQLSETPTPSPQVAGASVDYTVPNNANTISPTIANSPACAKTGFAQKWEYLTPYVIKQNDTIQNIASEQLKDETRVNEILRINGVGLVVGSTLYLPPSTINKSSGNIKQVYGKLMEKNSTSWHISFSSDPKGQGILIPSFWFEAIPNKDTYKIGDCLTVLFDEGFKVFSVSLQ